MNNISKKNLFFLERLIKKYPKKRSKLSIKLKKIFKYEYKINRDNKVNSLFEKWMHKNILRSKLRSYVPAPISNVRT